VEALEAKLSARLFDRNRDGYVLTDAGRDMLPRAERVEGEVAALERDLMGSDDRLEGTVALTCCDVYVSELLVKVLTPMCAAHPGLELCMSTDSRAFDLSKREADIAVRTLRAGTQPPEHLIGRKVAPVVVCNYVGRAHAERLEPSDPDTRFLAFEGRKGFEAMVGSSGYPDVKPWGAFSSMPLMVQAAVHGLGLVMLPTYVGDAEPGLIRLPRPALRHLADLWLVSHVDLRDNARLRTARRHVAEGLGRYLPLFQGDWPEGAPEGPEIAPDA
jgi:DNA-binding transcriptional LysR family regulator